MADADTDMAGSETANLPEKHAPSMGTTASDDHPSGKESFSPIMQIIRAVTVVVFFSMCAIIINLTQIIGSPLYFINRDWFYDYMAMTKRCFAVCACFGNGFWAPITIRISGDESVAGQIHATESGDVRFDFPERIILIANHQIYTDWLYLWWVAYANRPGTHGHLYIILKESLKHIPIAGWGMQFFSFIWMSRKMAVDQPRLAYRLRKLRQGKTGPNGKTYLDPMWLLLFPEGTTLSRNGRKKSAAWAKKNGLRDPDHAMLPRSTGMYFCLKELKGTVDYVYDCTVAYEGVPRGKYGEELYGLVTTYIQGRTPKSANFYWRRFRIDEIPLEDQATFDVWLREEWYKKDALIEQRFTTERFPPMAGSDMPYFETTVRTRSPWEILQIFTVMGICGLFWHIIRRSYQLASSLVGGKQA